MFNLKQAQLEKESALFADQMLRDYLWNHIYQNNDALQKAKKDQALQVLNDPNSTTAQLQSIVTLFGLDRGATPPPSNRADQTVNNPAAHLRSEMPESQKLHTWQDMARNRGGKVVGFDAASKKIVIEDLYLQSLPNHERGLLQQAFGELLTDGPDGMMLSGDPGVYRKFQQMAQIFMPRGVKLPDASEIKVDAGDGTKPQKLNKLLTKQPDAVKPKDLPFNKKLNAVIDQAPTLTKDVGTSTALIISFDPHAAILHSDSDQNDLGSLIQTNGWTPKAIRLDPRGRVIVFLNSATKGQVDGFRPSAEALKIVATLETFLKDNKYNTSAISNTMSQFGDQYGRRIVNDQKQKSREQLKPEDIAAATKTNEAGSSKRVANFENVPFDANDPASYYNLVDVVSNKVRGLYPNGFNNDIFPDEMKQKQAEAIARASTMKSVVLADMPGSGKTFMASATAHYHANMMDKLTGKKHQILVISPNGLVAQNWTTRPVPQGEPELTPLEAERARIEQQKQQGLPTDEPKLKGTAPKRFCVVHNSKVVYVEDQAKCSEFVEKQGFGNIEQRGHRKAGDVMVNNKWFRPSAPRQFLEPNMPLNAQEDGDADVHVVKNWDDPIRPDARWVVLRYDLFTDLGDPAEKQAEYEEALAAWQNAAPNEKGAALIAKEKKRKSALAALDRMRKINALQHSIRSSPFAAALLDESQSVKNVDSRRTQHVHGAIKGSAKSHKPIDKIVAMTGTPADDNPSDLYGQLMLINHPLLMRDGVPMSRTAFADQFFGGFGVKGRPPVDVKAFKSEIRNPDKIKTTIMLLDALAAFFIRREKDDINPLMYKKNMTPNAVPGFTENDLEGIRETGVFEAAKQKAAQAQRLGMSVADLFRKEANENPDDEQDESDDPNDDHTHGADVELIQHDDKELNPQEVAAAAKLIKDNPAEMQNAVLSHMAMLKVPETIKQAMEVLGSGPNVKPPKKESQVVVLGSNNEVIASGKLIGFEAKTQGKNLLHQEREVFARIEGENGQQTLHPRDSVVAANPEHVARKVFIVSKSYKAAKAIYDGLVAQAGPGVVELVTGKQGNMGSRNEITGAFQDENSELRALVMTMKLGSVGFNFEVADTCIFNDVSWNPSENEQASDRVYRITSPRNVNIKYNYLPIGEDAKMVSMVQAKEESNKKIQQCLKVAYEWKKKLLTDPTGYNENMAEAAAQFLQELAESMRQHQEAVKNKGGAQRQNTKPLSPIIPEPQPMGQTAKGWYHRLRLADKKARKPKSPPPMQQNMSPEEQAAEAVELLDEQRYEDALVVIDQLVDSENAGR